MKKGGFERIYAYQLREINKLTVIFAEKPNAYNASVFCEIRESCTVSLFDWSGQRLYFIAACRPIMPKPAFRKLKVW